MKKLLVTTLIGLLCLLNVSPVEAIVDPLSIPNNKFGIHILFDSELRDAAKLINTSGGDWGYVTIPIQSGDKDIEKWQKFMNDARELHLIPIIRLSTAGDYFNTAVWRKPKDEDIVDFANFLNSLDWPTKNRYVIVYNEVNRGDEWGGAPNPKEYAEILDFAVSQFRSINSDFFIISSGMDNAAANANNAMNQYTYMRAMDEAVPGIYGKVDGLASHSYPNPAFSQPPSVDTKMSITSFKYEQTLAQQLGGKKLPIFITETGWVNTTIPEDRVAEYYRTAFTSVWNDSSIVAVTPFLLRAGGGAFKPFSFLTEEGKETKHYDTIKSLSKVKGQPQVVIPNHDATLQSASDGPTMNFGTTTDKKGHVVPVVTSLFEWMFKL